MKPTQLVSRQPSLRSFAVVLFFLVFLIAAAPSAKVAVFLGDSLTAGYGIEPAKAFPALIQARIDSKGWNVKVVNAGQSGDTSAGGLARLDWLLKDRIDLLVLELGANDGLRGLPIEVTRKNLQAIIDQTRNRYPRAKVVVAGMKVPANMGRDYGARFESMFAELAKRNRSTLIPFILEGVGGVRELNLADGIHPTAAGHRIVADHVWGILRPLIEEIAVASN